MSLGMRHGRIEMTQRYTHLIPEDVAAKQSMILNLLNERQAASYSILLDEASQIIDLVPNQLPHPGIAGASLCVRSTRQSLAAQPGTS